MVRKVYEVNPLLCPECGAEMKIIAFIEDYKVIDKIICHLKISFMASVLLLKSSSRNSLWRPKRAESISESIRGCFLSI